MKLKSSEEYKRERVCAYNSHKFGHNEYSESLEALEKASRHLLNSLFRMRELIGLRSAAQSQNLKDYYEVYIIELDCSIQEEMERLKVLYNGFRQLP